MKGFFVGLVFSLIIFLICEYTPLFSRDGLTRADRKELSKLLMELE